MNDPLYDELIRLSLKRELNADDKARLQACLGAHPELRARFAEDAAVSELLRRLPNVPVSSNFTSVVMQAIELEDRAAVRQSERSRWRRPWLRLFQPRLSGLVALVLVTGFAGWEYRTYQRNRLAHDVQVLSQELASLPPDVFRDFDAIEGMRQASAGSDDELVKLLQQR